MDDIARLTAACCLDSRSWVTLIKLSTVIFCNTASNVAASSTWKTLDSKEAEYSERDLAESAISCPMISRITA